MKAFTIFIVLFTLRFFLFSPPPDTLPVPIAAPTPELSVQDLNQYQSNDSGEIGDEDDIFFYEQDSFSRKLFQRKLAPLPQHEKIVWAFRMSEPDLFL